MEIHECDSVFGAIFSLCFIGGIVLLIVCFVAYMILKYNMLKLNLEHELQMKREEWQRKKEWEEMVAPKAEGPENLKSKLSEKDAEIESLKNQLKSATQLDIERIALLVHSSSNSREYWTPEKTAKLIEQVKSTHEAIKKYLDM